MSKYGYSFCEERFSGPFDTLDEALAEALSYPHVDLETLDQHEGSTAD